MKHFLLLFLLFLVGFFRVAKSCSHGDDVARAGKYTKNLDEFNYNRSYNSASGHWSVTHYMNNLEDFAKNAKTEVAVDNIVATEIQKAKPELSEELSKIEKIEDKFQKKLLFEKFKKEKLSEKEYQKFLKISKALKLALNVKDFYQLEGMLKADSHSELTEDKSYSFQDFQVRIPKGFYHLHYISHPLMKGFWSDQSTVIFVLKSNSNKEKLVADWKNFKQGKNLRELKILNHEGNTLDYQLFQKKLPSRYGKIKIVQEAGNYMLIDLEYSNPEAYEQEADLLMRKL